MYELLIFDADHTLWDFDKAEAKQSKRLFIDFKFEFKDTYLDIYRKINFSLWKKFELNEMTQGEIKVERFKSFFQKLDIDTNYKENSHNYLIYLSRGNYLFPGAYDLINDLKNKYSLALLTNGISIVQHPRYEKSELFGMFDAFVVSGDLGISKPDKRIYDYTLDKFGITDKSKVLMIGDSLSFWLSKGIGESF